MGSGRGRRVRAAAGPVSRCLRGCSACTRRCVGVECGCESGKACRIYKCCARLLLVLCSTILSSPAAVLRHSPTACRVGVTSMTGDSCAVVSWVDLTLSTPGRPASASLQTLWAARWCALQTHAPTVRVPRRTLRRVETSVSHCSWRIHLWSCQENSSEHLPLSCFPRASSRTLALFAEVEKTRRGQLAPAPASTVLNMLPHAAPV